MDFESARTRLVEHLTSEVNDGRVLAAMARVPRERFLTPGERSFAYDNRPLPIGYGQTISQPLIVALMTEALQLTGAERVLEIGTGSGYQTAVLAELAREVVTVERFAPLTEAAKSALDELGYKNIKLCPAGEVLGWPEGAPYDAILVTAGAPKVPRSLLAQLAEGGRMVLPVGSRWQQGLYRVTRTRGKTSIESLGGCAFVPLIGEDAWAEE